MDFVREDIRNNLNRFANVVWGNAQAVLRPTDSPGVEYIDLAGSFDGLRFIFGSVLSHDKILVRDEYRIALRELQTHLYRRGAYVTGHPGIGKTLFLIYLLVELLGQQRMVAVQFTVDDRRVYAIFGDTVTFHLLYDTAPLQKLPVTWALTDSNSRIRTPSSVFYDSTNRIRTIQATSPREGRWKEWSKEAGAECYVMDIWSEQEIADLAKLLNLDAKRMSILANKWGCVPRRLLRFLDLSDWQIEIEYRRGAAAAVQKCRVAISSAMGTNVVEEGPSRFFFCRPMKTEKEITRIHAGAYVPTPTLRSLLGEALQAQDNVVKLDFFRVLSQFNETRQSAGYIFESWFHSYFIAAKSLQCHWAQGLDGVSSLTGTATLIPTTWGAFNVHEPPFYWIAPKNFPGIDSALVLDREIYAFQVTISFKHKSPIVGLQTLRDHLPTRWKRVSWRVVFVGDDESTVQEVANDWVDQLTFPTNKTILPIAWSAVDPVTRGIPWKVYKDEELPDEESMDVA